MSTYSNAFTKLVRRAIIYSKINILCAFAAFLGAVGSLVLGASGLAQAGDVAGRIELSRPSTKAKPPKGAYIRPIPNGFMPVRSVARPASEEVVVALVGGSAKAETSCAYELRNGGPGATAWVAGEGAKLIIENKDGVPYQVYAEGLDVFKPIQTAPGSTRTVTVSGSGVWPLKDKSYAHLDGALHVVKGLVDCAPVSSTGTFRFKGVDTGSYKLQVFHGKEVIKVISVRVSGTKISNVDPIIVQLPAPTTTGEGSDPS